MEDRKEGVLKEAKRDPGMEGEGGGTKEEDC